MNWEKIEKSAYDVIAERTAAIPDLKKQAESLRKQVDTLSKELPQTVEGDLYGFKSQTEIEIGRKQEQLAVVEAKLKKMYAYSLESALRLKEELHKRGLPAIAILPEKVAMKLMKGLYIFHYLEPDGCVKSRPLPVTALEVVPRIMIFLTYFFICFLCFAYFGVGLVANAVAAFVISASIFSEPVTSEHIKKFGKEKFVLRAKAARDGDDGSADIFVILQWVIGALYVVVPQFGFPAGFFKSFALFFVPLFLSFFIRARLTKRNLLIIVYLLFTPQLLKKRYYLPGRVDGRWPSAGRIRIVFNTPVSTSFIQVLERVRQQGLQPVIAADKKSFIINDDLLFQELFDLAEEEEKQNILLYERRRRDPIVMTVHEIDGERFVAVHIQEGDFISEKEALKRVKKAALTLSLN